MSSILRGLQSRIISDIRVELLDEFDQNFVRKAFFDRPWPSRNYPGRRGSLLQVTGRGRRGIRGTKSSTGVTFSTDTSYMGLHNSGGKVQITPRMRKYFWAMYYKSAGDMTHSSKKRVANNTARNRKLSDTAQFWRNMALTKKQTITMPQRQFLGDHPKVRTAVRQIIDNNMQRAFRDLAKALKPRQNPFKPL